jgi:hypothetical protein
MSEFTMPVRPGARPQTGDRVPHLQLSDTSPEGYVDELMAWAVSEFEHASEVPTRISVRSTRALWLAETVPAAHDDAFMPPAGGREFAHVHADGSMHLCVSDVAVRELIEKSWGEAHPMKDQGVNEVLCYAPRTRDEIELVKVALLEAYGYATGSRSTA